MGLRIGGGGGMGGFQPQSLLRGGVGAFGPPTGDDWNREIGGGFTQVGDFFGGNSPFGQKAGNFFDGLDVTGNRADKRWEETKNLYDQQNATIQQQMQNRPQWQSMVDEKGNLRPGFEATAAQMQAAQGQASSMDFNKLTAMQGDAKNVQADRINKASQLGSKNWDVSSGDDFAQARTDMAALRGDAFGQGPSLGARAQLKQQDLYQQNARDQVARDSQANLQTSFSNMASQGGLEGGARERMSRMANRDQMLGNQGIAQQGMGARLGIAAQDEAMKQGLRQAMPGMGMQMDAYSTGLQGQNMGRQMQAGMFDVNTDQQRQQTNAQLGLAGDQFNANLAMQKAGQWGGFADADAARQTQMSQWNAGAQNQAGALNAQLDTQARMQNVNAYRMDNLYGNQAAQDAWGQGMQVLGAQGVAGQMMNQQARGGFLERLGLGST